MHPSKFLPVVVPESGPRGVAPQLLLPEVYDKAMKDRSGGAIQGLKCFLLFFHLVFFVFFKGNGYPCDVFF